MIATINDFPRCAAYLKGMRVRLNDETMTDYAFAVVLSEKWTDEELVEDGRVNFDTMSGRDILSEFERLLRAPRKADAVDIAPADMERLKAFIGSRGVKVSALSGLDDYVKVSRVLWPSSIGRDVKTYGDLLSTISGMGKKARAEAVRTISKVPAKWRGR